MSLLALTLVRLALASLQVQELHEIAVLETSPAEVSLAFVNALALEGRWLAAGGADLNGFESHVLFHREGAAWIPLQLPVTGGFVDLEGERYATSSAENHRSSVLRRVDGSWVLEAQFRADYAALFGNRLLTNSFEDFAVDVWRREGTTWQPDGTLKPAGPQDAVSCCFPIEVWGNTAVFAARGASGDGAVQVFVRRNGGWNQEAELVPAEFLGTGRGILGGIQLWGNTIAASYFDGSETVTFVWEREQGAWHERARLAPGGEQWSLALEKDTLVIGLGDPVGVALVYERSQGSWTLSARLVPRSGQRIGRAIALEDHLVLVSTNDSFPPEESRIFVFRVPPFPRLTTYGCGVNPAGSLTVRAGAPTVGGSVRIALDNPLGSQAPGSLVWLGFGARPDPHHPCGALVPRTGMAGGPGELLLRRDALVRGVGAWSGPGQPLETEIAIPADPALVGRAFYLQGALQDPTPGARVRFGLTEGLELEIGASVVAPAGARSE